MPEIVTMRKEIWAHIPSRDHHATQIYTHGHDQMQLMARGKVAYKHHKGHQSETEWGAYWELVDQDEAKGKAIKIKKLHIIVVSNSFCLSFHGMGLE